MNFLCDFTDDGKGKQIVKMLSANLTSSNSHNDTTKTQCAICVTEMDNLPSNNSRQMYRLCSKYLHSGIAKEIPDDCELEGSFSDGAQILLCRKCLGSAKELEELTQTLASLRKRVSDMVIVFTLEILHRRGKNTRNEEAVMKLIQVDVSKLPENDSWSSLFSPTFTTPDEIASSEIQENVARVRCMDKEDNVHTVHPIAYDLDVKDIVEIELLTEAELLAGNIGGPLINTPCAISEPISPQENVACVTEIGNTLDVSGYDTNECIIRTTGGKDQNSSTETNASEIAVGDVVTGENIDLTKCKDRQPKTITERNEKNIQDSISMPSVRLHKLRFQYKTNENGEYVMIVNDGVRSAKPNLLPKSEYILTKESQVLSSKTPEDLDTVQGLPVPSMLPNQMASESSTVCASSTAKQGKSARLRKTSVRKSSVTKFKIKQSGDSAKGSLEKDGFPCDVCKKIFLLKPLLLEHKRQHKSSRSYKCAVCSQRFPGKHQLKTHHRLKHGNKTVKCSFCDKEFSSNFNLNDHFRTHTGEKPFKCSFCNRDFGHRGTLKNHILTHTGEKPYKCASCKKSFSRKYNLITHVRTHTNEKPYKCDWCNYSCARLNQLTLHKVFRHSNKCNFRCQECQNTFKRRKDAKRHYKSVHKNIEFNDECIIDNN